MAPRSFSTLSLGHDDREVALVLHGIAGADLVRRLERQGVDVLAVGLAGDPHGQHAVGRIRVASAETSDALQGRCRDGEQVRS